MAERVFSNGRNAYIVAPAVEDDQFNIWFTNSMGTERWSRPVVSSSQLEAKIADWGRAGYREAADTKPRDLPRRLDLSDKQFHFLSREIAVWRRRKFEAWGEMQEPGDYTFEIAFEARFGFQFAEWETTTHARGYDLHPPIRTEWANDHVERLWNVLTEEETSELRQTRENVGRGGVDSPDRAAGYDTSRSDGGVQLDLQNAETNDDDLRSTHETQTKRPRRKRRPTPR